MAELTPSDITGLLAAVKKGQEYEHPDCRSVVDVASAKLTTLVADGALNTEPGLEAINKILDDIADAIRAAQAAPANATPTPAPAQASPPESEKSASAIATPETIHHTINLKGYPPEIQQLLATLDKSYDEASSTLSDFGFKDVPPSKILFLYDLLQLGPLMLETIRQFGKPTVIITPRGSFASKIQAIDSHIKFPNQVSTNCDPQPKDTIWGPKPTKMTVSVVDGDSRLQQQHFIKNDTLIDEKLEIYEKEFARENLQIMSAHEGAMLMMQSLRRGHPIDIDKLQEPATTVTYYRRSKHAKINRHIAVNGSYKNDPGISYVCFNKSMTGTHDKSLRCRPSVKVLEI